MLQALRPSSTSSSQSSIEREITTVDLDKMLSNATREHESWIWTEIKHNNTNVSFITDLIKKIWQRVNENEQNREKYLVPILLKIRTKLIEVDIDIVAILSSTASHQEIISCLLKRLSEDASITKATQERQTRQPTERSSETQTIMALAYLSQNHVFAEYIWLKNIPTIINLLKSAKSEESKKYAAECLINLYSDTQEINFTARSSLNTTIDSLFDCLETNSETTNQYVTQCLAHIFQTFNKLKDEDKPVCQLKISKEQTDKLITFLDSKNSLTQQHAVQCLAAMCEADNIPIIRNHTQLVDKLANLVCKQPDAPNPITKYSAIRCIRIILQYKSNHHTMEETEVALDDLVGQQEYATQDGEFHRTYLHPTEQVFGKLSFDVAQTTPASSKPTFLDSTFLTQLFESFYSPEEDLSKESLACLYEIHTANPDQLKAELKKLTQESPYTAKEILKKSNQILLGTNKLLQQKYLLKILDSSDISTLKSLLEIAINNNYVCISEKIALSLMVKLANLEPPVQGLDEIQRYLVQKKEFLVQVLRKHYSDHDDTNSRASHRCPSTDLAQMRSLLSDDNRIDEDSTSLPTISQATLTAALNAQNPLGKIFWTQRGIYPPSLHSGSLQQIRKIKPEPEQCNIITHALIKLNFFSRKKTHDQMLNTPVTNPSAN